MKTPRTDPLPQVPVAILAGVEYTGTPTAQWVCHVRLLIESGIQERVAARRAAHGAGAR